MTKKKGPKKAKTLFMPLRMANKKTRHMTVVPAVAAVAATAPAAK